MRKETILLRGDDMVAGRILLRRESKWKDIEIARQPYNRNIDLLCTCIVSVKV